MPKKKPEKWMPNLRHEWMLIPNFPGTYLCFTVIDSYPAPIGEMWVTFAGIPDAVEIVDMHVNTHYRRQGIATGLMNFVMETWECKSAYSGSKSSTAGAAWMLKYGFKVPSSGIMKGEYLYNQKGNDNGH